MTITIEQILPGVRKGHRCVAPGGQQSGKPCTRYKPIGTLTVSAHGGANTTRFTGGLNNRVLAAGNSYRATIVETTPGALKRSRRRQATFTIVKP